jgi:antitoxin component YwqK of YwqJK toxin-antitoxin module
MPILEKYHKNGKIRLRQVTPDADIRTDSLTKWYDTGVLMVHAEFTREGNNTIREYDPAGRLMAEEVVIGLIGERVCFYETGEVKSRVGLDNGEIHGTAIDYSKDGKVMDIQYWMRGRQVDEATWKKEQDTHKDVTGT